MATALTFKPLGKCGHVHEHNFRHLKAFEKRRGIKNVFAEDSEKNRDIYSDEKLRIKCNDMTRQPAPLDEFGNSIRNKDGKIRQGRKLQQKTRRFAGVCFWADRSMLELILDEDGNPKQFETQARTQSGKYRTYSDGSPIMTEVTRYRFRSEDVRRKFEAVVLDFCQSELPGAVVELVSHVDERTPHIDGMIAPVDANGNLKYREMFGSPMALKKIQSKWRARLEKEFGIEARTRDEIDERKTTNLPHEVYVERKQAANILQSHERFIEEVKNMDSKLPETKPMESAKKFRARVVDVFDNSMKAVKLLQIENERLQDEAVASAEREASMLRTLREVSMKLLEHVPGLRSWMRSVGVDRSVLDDDDGIDHTSPRSQGWRSQGFER